MESTQKCTTPGCDRHGQPEFSGKCPNCFHGNRHMPQESTSDTKIAEGSALNLETDAGEELPSEGKSLQRCLVEGCSNYGNKKNNFLCNGCMSYIQKELANRGHLDKPNGNCPTPKCPNDSNPKQLCNECKEIFSSSKSLRYTSQLSRSKCVTETCNNYGSTEKGNLCNDCYNKHPFNCRTKNCPHYSLAKNDFFCSSCFKGTVIMHEHAVCSTPECSRQAFARFDWKCEKCYPGTTECTRPGCHELPLADRGDLCFKCASQTTTGLFASADGGGDGAGLLLAGNPFVIPLLENSRSAGDATDLSSSMHTSLNVSSHTSFTGAEHGPSTDWKQCLTSGCGNVGTTGGLCFDCYIKQLDAQSIGFQNCITQGCTGHGQQIQKGFCDKCYSSHQHLDPSCLSFSSATAAKNPITCITPNCKFFGREEQGGLCSQCFKDFLKSSAPGPTRTIRPDSQESSVDSRCKTPGCEFFGNPDTRGLCSECFRIYLEDQPQLPRRRRATGPSAYFSAGGLTPELRRNEISAMYATGLTGTAGGVSNSSASSILPKVNTGQDTHCPDIIVNSPDKPTPLTEHGDQIFPEPNIAMQANLLASASPESIHSDPLLLVQEESGLGTERPLLQHIDSNEIFGEGMAQVKPPPIPMQRSISTPGGFTVLPQKCKNQTCERNCVEETAPYCMSCYEAKQVQPGAHAEASSMPLSPQTLDRLKTDQSSRLKSSSNPNLPSLSDICESEGCGNSVSASHYPLCMMCGQESEGQGKARPTAAGNAVQNENPTISASQIGQEQLNVQRTTGDRSNDDRLDNVEKKKVSLKPVTLDPCMIKCDVIICLWNKQNIESGTHPFFARIGNTNICKSALLRDEVCEARGDRTKAELILHCKYDQVADRQIANALLRCLSYTEVKKKTSIVLPVTYCDDLKQNPRMMTRVCMYVISHLQTSNRYTQCLEKFVMCVDSPETIKLCKEEFVSIDAKKRRQEMPVENRSKCLHCKRNPSAKLKPLSTSCDDQCSVFCIPCLKRQRQEWLLCPQHGPCLAPIGHKNTYALLVAGFDVKVAAAQIFIKDTDRMARALSSENFIGISDRNIKVIKANNPGKEEDIKSRVIAAFTDLRSQMKRNNHATFYFYYSGHNDKKALKLGGVNNTMTPAELKKELRKFDVENILIILDCCYSGGANLTEDISDEDFTTSLGSCAKDDSEPLIYLPKLWNLEDDLEEDSGDKGNPTRVFQWASSVEEEKSYFKNGQSFFTHCIVQALKGHCPSKQVGCESCKTYKRKVLRADGVFLSTIHESVECHVPQLAERIQRQQHPQLDSSNGREENFLFAFPYDS